MAIPVAVFLLVWAALTRHLSEDRPLLVHVAFAALATVVLAGSAGFLALPLALALMTVPSILLVTDQVVGAHTAHRGAVNTA